MTKQQKTAKKFLCTDNYSFNAEYASHYTTLLRSRQVPKPLDIRFEIQYNISRYIQEVFSHGTY